MSRTGLSINEVDLDARLNKIELDLGTRALANQESSSPAQRAQSTSIPQVTGIRTNNQIVGAISFEWNPVQTNFLYYEIDISSSENFSKVETKRYKVSGQTYFIVSDVPPEQAKFVRVRVVANGGNGPWSSSLNTSTGKATPNQLVVGAASNIVRHVQTSFDPPVLSNKLGINIGTYGNIDLETIGGLVIIFASIKYEVYMYDKFKLEIYLKEDGQIIEEFINIAVSAPFTNSNSIMTLPGMAIPSSPSPGIHTYTWDVVLSDYDGDTTAEHEFQPLRITTALVEFRR